MNSQIMTSSDITLGYILLAILYVIIGIILSIAPAMAFFGIGAWSHVRSAKPNPWRLLIGALWLVMVAGFTIGVTVHSFLHLAPIPGAAATIIAAYFGRRVRLKQERAGR